MCFVLFLTDEVRLHCGPLAAMLMTVSRVLFLTDEVRLHCGTVTLVLVQDATGSSS